MTAKNDIAKAVLTQFF